jgi:hypothetical protein
MAETAESLLQHYRESRRELLAAIDGLTDEALCEPSLDGWSVKDHLLHIALWDEFREGEVIRISAGHEAAWPLDVDYGEFGYEHRKRLGVAQAKWELLHSRQRLLDAIAAASSRGLDGSLYREAGLKSTHEAQHAQWIRRWRTEKGL